MISIGPNLVISDSYKKDTIKLLTNPKTGDILKTKENYAFINTYDTIVGWMFFVCPATQGISEELHALRREFI